MSSISVIRRRTVLLAALAAVVGAVTISACSSEPSDSGTITLTLAQSSINVVAGGTGGTGATITRGAPFTGPVTLSATGAPTGVAVTFTPAVIPAGALTATVNVAVDAGVAAGSIPLSIRATGDGVGTVTKPLEVVVGAAGAGGISLAATPATLTNVAVGAAPVTSAIAITRLAPFAGPVNLTVSGMPPNVSASLSPAIVLGGATASVLSVTAATGAVNGTYPLVVQGAGTGIVAATTTVQATVTGGAQGISFAFGTDPLPLTAGAASGNSAVTITRDGYVGAVALSVAFDPAPPAGLTASVAPTNTTTSGTTATVTAQATAAVPAGTYDLVLTGTGSGIPTATAHLPVNVTGGGGGGSASVTFCAEDAPIWVAAQDGSSGAWTRVMPTTTGGLTYQFTFASGKGGIATVDTVGSGTDLEVIYATLADFTAYSGAVNNGGCSSNKVVSGAVSGVGATEAAIVNLGGSSDFVVPPDAGFTLNNVPAGPQDLMATRNDATTFDVNWIILRRGLNPNTGAVLPILTFGTEGFPPVSATVGVTGLGVDTGFVASLFTGVRGSAFAFLSSISDFVSTTPAQPYAAIPSPQLNAGELQELFASATQKGNPNSDRSAGIFFTSVSNRTIALGPNLSTPTVTKVVVTPNALPSVSLASQAEYNRYIIASYDQGGIGRSASVVAQASYYGSLPSPWNVAVPDLSGVSGWSDDWGLLNGTPIDWDVTAYGGVIPILDPNISDGSAFRNASIQSSSPLALHGLREAGPFRMQRRLLDALAGPNRSPLH